MSERLNSFQSRLIKNRRVSLPLLDNEQKFSTFLKDLLSPLNDNDGITITIVDIIHRPVFYAKHNVSETGFCFLLLVEPELRSFDRVSIRTGDSMFHLKTETESSLRNVFNKRQDDG
jgi:hypothetical protein